MRTIEEILADAHHQGLLLNNLFERSDGFWWAEFRPFGGQDYGYAAAFATTPNAALQEALAKFQAPLTSIDELF